jgi:hypothetical protein
MKHIYFRFIYFAFFLIFGFAWLGCNVINPHEQVPTYIHIDSFRFTANPLVRAASSHQITQVWAYYDNNPVGVFDLPCTFPINTNGATTGQLELSPGVVVDGLNDLLSGYPFYEFDTSTIVSAPGKVINYLPKTTMFSTVKSYTISNFEGNTGFALWGGDQPMTIVNDSAVFEGHGSGSILLSAVGDSSVDSTVIPFAIPTGSAFIEFNYKSDLQFYVGLQANQGTLISTTPYYLAGINPSKTWQKFYLSVADFAAQYKGTTYNLYIKTSLSAGITQGRLLLDNIQLLTF